MAKTLKGIIISNNMKDTAIVEVSWKRPHPLYKKLLKRSKKYKVATNGSEVHVGEQVTIVETKPVSKDKHFKIAEGGKSV